MTDPPFDLDPVTRPTVTVGESAVVLGVSRSSAFAAARTGELPTIRVGRRLLVPTAALRRMLQLELADEAEPIREAMGDEQDEAVEVDDAVLELALRVVEVHVAGEAGGGRSRCLRRRRSGRGQPRHARRRGQRHGDRAGAIFLTTQNDAY